MRNLRQDDMVEEIKVLEIKSKYTIYRQDAKDAKESKTENDIC